MKNAHERFGRLGFTKRLKDTTTDICLHLERFIGEVDGDRGDKRAHLISVICGDSDVAAAWAAAIEESFFTVEGPGRGRAGLQQDPEPRAAICLELWEMLLQRLRELRNAGKLPVLATITKPPGKRYYTLS